ncbi:hypothetical protein [Rubritalea tangerina]|uniref:hypothetical protein n=1 Tax=Rubritalea tangerina TaxID=430798 RepID=UPI00360EA96C
MNLLTNRFANPSAIMALGLSLFAVSSQQLDAVNVGVTTYCSSVSCDECDENGDIISVPKPAGTVCTQVGSIEWAMKLGEARRKIRPSYTDMSIVGKFEGAVRGKIRTFKDVYREVNDPSALAFEDVMLEINMASINASILSPEILKIHSDAEFEKLEHTTVVSSGSSSTGSAVTVTKTELRQVLTKNAFTDVEKLETGFIIRLWNRADINISKTSKYYTLPTEVEPIQEIEFRSVPNSTATFEFMMIIKERFGSNGIRTITEHHKRDATHDTLVVTTHEGEGLTGTPIHKQEITYTDRGNMKWDYTLERKVYEASVDTQGTLGSLVKVAHTQETYRDYSFFDPNLPNSQQGGKEECVDSSGRFKTFLGRN